MRLNYFQALPLLVFEAKRRFYEERPVIAFLIYMFCSYQSFLPRNEAVT